MMEFSSNGITGYVYREQKLIQRIEISGIPVKDCDSSRH